MRISFFTHDIPQPSLCLICLSAPSSLWPHCSTGRSGLEYWFTWGKSMCPKAVFCLSALLSSRPSASLRSLCVPLRPSAPSLSVGGFLFLTQILERSLPTCREQIYLLYSQDMWGNRVLSEGKTERIHKWRIRKTQHHSGCSFVSLDLFAVYAFLHLNSSLFCTNFI